MAVAAYDMHRYDQRNSRRPRIEVVSKAAKRPNRTASRRKGLSPARAILCLIVAIVVASALLFVRVQLNEITDEISQKQTELSKLQADNVRLNLELEGKISLANVEKIAAEDLGMQKKENTSIQYLKLIQNNKIEIPENNEGFIESIVSFFSGLFS